MNDLSSQLFVYMPFGVVFIIVFVCLCRLYFDRKTDERAEREFENLERLNQRAGEEIADCTERVTEIKDGARELFEANKYTRNQVESASNSIEEARRNNRTSAEAVARIEEILSEAKKI